MLRHVVPAALERYCTLRNLSPAEAVDELAKVAELLGPERPVLVHRAATPPTPRAAETLTTLVAGL